MAKQTNAELASALKTAEEEVKRLNDELTAERKTAEESVKTLNDELASVKLDFENEHQVAVKSDQEKERIIGKFRDVYRSAQKALSVLAERNKAVRQLIGNQQPGLADKRLFGVEAELSKALSDAFEEELYQENTSETNTQDTDATSPG